MVYAIMGPIISFHWIVSHISSNIFIYIFSHKTTIKTVWKHYTKNRLSKSVATPAFPYSPIIYKYVKA